MAHMWAQRVPHNMLFEVQALVNPEVEFDFLRLCHLQPKKTPDWLLQHVGEPLGFFSAGVHISGSHFRFQYGKFLQGFLFLTKDLSVLRRLGREDFLSESLVICLFRLL